MPSAHLAKQKKKQKFEPNIRHISPQVQHDKKY